MKEIIAKVEDSVKGKELIRCKECEYWLPHEMYGWDERPHNYCAMHLPEDEYYAIRKNANDFCSWAKRKEE